MTTRSKVIEAIKEARSNGLTLKRISKILEVSERTMERWLKSPQDDGRKGSVRNVHNKLSIEERSEILRVVNCPEYSDLTPGEIVAILAENRQYIGSERTIYRILKEEKLLAHRGPGRSRVKREKMEHKATGPGQLYSWDITYLKTDVRGIYFYLYMVMDVWSRKIVAWEVHNEENSELAASMIESLSKETSLLGTVLHSDNGGPMKGSTMLFKLYELGVFASFSRPRVSEDNPYSESLFKTLKYKPGYPGKFKNLDDTRNWVADFVNWYNNVHRHTSINYVTPSQRHSGEDIKILAIRREVFKKARNEHPSRWPRHSKKWEHQKLVTLGKISVVSAAR